MDSTRIKRLAIGLLLAGSPGAIVSAAPFTWDPSQVPALAGAGPAFTADRIVMSDYVYVIQPAADFTPYPASYLFTITGFTRQGVAVAPIGLGTTYGLYFTLEDTNTLVGGQAISGAGSIRLMADPTNNDGLPSVTQANGLTFANPAGVADDIVLATGQQISGSFVIQNGIASKRFLDTFAPSPGKEAFFVDPASSNLLIELFNTNTATSRQFVVQPDGSGITLVNGAIGSATLQVPEPASIAVLALGLLGLASLRRRG